MDIGPLRIETGFCGDAAGNMWWDVSWSWKRRIRNRALEDAYAALHKEARDIISAGDQFDQGGDIYSKAGYLLAAAEIIAKLKR
jgi:hypothetical protein